MGYQNLINRNVVKSFKLAKDLVDTVEFFKINKGEFDFATGTQPDAETTNAFVKVIVTDSTKKSELHSVTEKEMLFQTNNIDLKAYDSVRYKSEIWKIGPVLYNNGFLSTIKIYKETA